MGGNDFRLPIVHTSNENIRVAELGNLGEANPQGITALMEKRVKP
jgi:hypothetical protein